jgi:hypothetical protein
LRVSFFYGWEEIDSRDLTRSVTGLTTTTVSVKVVGVLARSDLVLRFPPPFPARSSSSPRAALSIRPVSASKAAMEAAICACT